MIFSALELRAHRARKLALIKGDSWLGWTGQRTGYDILIGVPFSRLVVIWAGGLDMA